MAVIARRADAADAKALLALSDRARQKLGDAVVVLGTAVDGRVHLVVNVAPAVVERGVKAGEVVARARPWSAAAAADATPWPRPADATPSGSTRRWPRRAPRSIARCAADHAHPGARPRRGPLRLCGLGPLGHAGHAARRSVERPDTRKGLARLAALAVRARGRARGGRTAADARRARRARRPPRRGSSPSACRRGWRCRSSCTTSA